LRHKFQYPQLTGVPLWDSFVWPVKKAAWTAEAVTRLTRALVLVPVPPAGDWTTGRAHDMEHQADNQQDYADHHQYVGKEKSQDGEDNSKSDHVSAAFTLY
jgi:hypothetical protein